MSVAAGPSRQARALTAAQARSRHPDRVLLVAVARAASSQGSACPTTVSTSSGQATQRTPTRGTEPPDLELLQALAECADLADAVTRLCDCYSRPLAAGARRAKARRK